MTTFSTGFPDTENPLATNWTTVTGVDGGMRASGGVAYNATAYEGGSYYDGTAPANDQYAEAKFPSSSGSGWSGGCGVRYGSGSCYLFELDGTNVQMKEVAGGAFSDLGSPAALSFTATDVVRISAVGTTIKVQKNGTDVVSATDSTLTSGTGCIYGWNNYSTGNHLDIDDFVLSDDFGGGGGTSVTLSPLAGTITWNGKLHSVRTVYKAAPLVANVAWNGGRPTTKLGIKVSPPIGNVNWNGGLPTLKTFYRISPLAGLLLWNGQLPTVGSKILAILSPYAGNVSWNGGLPTTKTTYKASPSAGNVAWNGGLAALKTFYRISPLAGTVLWNGQLPTVDSKIMVSLSPFAGNVSWNGGLPTAKTTYKISPAAGTVNWNGGLATASFPTTFAWTAVSRASTAWNSIARTTQTWTRIQRDGSTLWTTRERPYDEEV